MLKSFRNHIENNLPFLTNSRLLVAISGGIDSVVLTHLCYKIQLNVALAHCNFSLRGEESDADEQFVVQLAEANHLEVFLERFDTEKYAIEHKLSVQIAARELRYDWFQELAEQLEFDYILTAHHADDNLETFLINLSRGTGLDGLMGIPEVNGNIVRPLLSFSREAIEVYAKANGLEWREDSSNAATKYLRNKLRHGVIPKLKEINPQLLDSLKQTQDHLRDTGQIIEDRIEEVVNTVIEEISDNELYFNLAELMKLNQPKAYLYELLKDYGFTEWNDIANLLTAQSGKQVFSKTHRLLKDRTHLILTEIHQKDPDIISIDRNATTVETSLGSLSFEEAIENSDNSNNSIWVDKSLLSYPLELRPFREGDYFYPLGMNGKKKLSKYFKDEKLSLADKEKCLLLCSGNDIVWILGRRADDRFKVSKETKDILKIELH